MNKAAEAAAKQARALLAKCRVESVPVPVDSIARSRGITVQHLPLDDDLSGMSFVKGGSAVIVVNAGHHPNRQRFTLAHELGHHILHADYLENNVHVDKAILHRNHNSSTGQDLKEVEANSFAAELLMPLSQVRWHKDVDINNEAQLIAIAKKFKVSTAAITIRILNIK